MLEDQVDIGCKLCMIDGWMYTHGYWLGEGSREGVEKQEEDEEEEEREKKSIFSFSMDM